MHRTQIYLSEDELAVLDRAVKRTGASRSELIRRAVRERYGTTDAESRRRLLQATAGAWKDWDLSGEDYVESIRGDANDRLERLWST